MITVLSGSNKYGIRQSIDKIVSGFDGHAERLNPEDMTSATFADVFSGVSLFADNRLVIIDHLPDEKNGWLELEKWIDKDNEALHVVLLETSPDKRTRTYKALQKQATIVDHPEHDEVALISWLEALVKDQNIDMGRGEIKFFIQYVGKNQWRLRNELDKLQLSDSKVTEALIKDICEPYPEASAFALIDAFLDRDIASVDRLLGTLQLTEDPYQFFGLLSSQAQVLLAIIYAPSGANIAKDMGAHPFVVKKLTPLSSRLGLHRVERIVDVLAETDARMKRTSDPWFELSTAIKNLTYLLQ